MSDAALRALRREALARANMVRMERARLVGGTGRRRGAKVAPEYVAELLVDPPEALLGMRVDQLIARVERYRWARTARLLASERISESRLVRDLTERQRYALAARLRSKK